MIFKGLNKIYIEEAVKLAKENYLLEQQHVDALYNKNYEKEIYQNVTRIFEKEMGIVAIDNDKLIGYLAFPNYWETHIAGVKETFSPICGYGIHSSYDRAKIISMLFQKASEKMLRDGVGRFNITVYAHDVDVISSYVLNQFGILCTDTIKNLNDIICTECSSKCNFEELSKGEITNNLEQLLAMWRKLANHLQMSPTYYLGEEFTDDVYWNHINDENTRLFVARDGNKIIGIMDSSIGGNNFANNDEGTVNIGDLYIEESYRGQNIAQEFLQYVSNVLISDGYKRLWVEHGTTNPTAQHFWDRYFSRFTYTLTRNIDERVLKLYTI